jgi:acetyl esterase
MVNELASEFDSDLPIFIAGEGAGAHLALEVQLNATREVRSALKGQILVSPVLDPDSNEEGAPGGQDQLISRPMIRWCWGQYLPSKSTQDRLSSYPLQRSQLVGLPATLIMTAEFDPVGRESEALGRELLASNVEVVTRRFDGQIHGFFRCLMLPVGELAFQELISFIRARLPIRGGVVAPRQMEWKGT